MIKKQKSYGHFVIYKMESIQALRGIAALFVICQHICFLQRGSFGVDLFFLISGFVVMLSTERSTDHFFGKRAVRILPLYWTLTVIIWGVVLIFPDLFENTEGTFMNLYRSLIFVPFSQDGVIQPIVRVGWTINYEVQFYILFLVSMQISWRFRALICSGMLAGLTLIGALFPKLPGPFAFWTDSIIMEFALGMGLFYVVHAMFGLLCRQSGNTETPQSAVKKDGQEHAETAQHTGPTGETKHAEAFECAVQEAGHVEASECAVQEAGQEEAAECAALETKHVEVSACVVREAGHAGDPEGAGQETEPAQAEAAEGTAREAERAGRLPGARKKSEVLRRYLGWYGALILASAAVFFYEWKSYELPAVCRLPEIIRWGLPSVLLFLLFVAAGMRVHMPRLLTKIGDMSFSIYLLHYYPMQFLNRMLHHTTAPNTQEVLTTLAVVAAVILVSWLSYFLIEKKLGNYLRRELLSHFNSDKPDPDEWPMIML